MKEDFLGERLMSGFSPKSTRELGSTIDDFIETMIKISSLATNDPEKITSAPKNLPVGRLDEAQAARNPILTWKQ